MLFAVLFEDDQTKFEIRKNLLSEHIDWLDNNKTVVLVGGSLRKAIGDQPNGGLWIVKAHTKEEVQSIVEDDPFWIHGLRKSVEILHWSKAFEDRFVEV